MKIIKTTTEWLPIVDKLSTELNYQGKQLYDYIRNLYNVDPKNNDILDLAIWINLSNKKSIKLPEMFFE